MAGQSIVPLERVEQAILLIRGVKVILDSDLANLYGVETHRLNEQVRRNIDRFPPDFMFQLTDEEHGSLRSQFAILDAGRGRHRKYLPYAFTEHGAIMAASVLSSAKAIEMSILVVRAFVKLRNILATHRQLVAKLIELERKLGTHDRKFIVLFDAIRKLMAPPRSPKRRIGFVAPVVEVEDGRNKPRTPRSSRSPRATPPPPGS
jgi:phage regulator Rha-like protein